MPVSDPIRSLLQRWLPGRDLDIRRASSGGSTEVYRVRFGEETCWLRLAEDPGEDRSVEYMVHDRLRGLGVRVPEILTFEVDPPELDRSAALTSHMPGVPLSECADADLANSVAFAAGEDLARINSIPVSGFGWIDRIESGDIVAEHSTRQDWALEYAEATARIASADILPGPAIPVLESATDDWLRIDRGPRTHLAHGDFDVSHIYYDPVSREYTGIIDFGEARGTECEYDLGHALLHDGEGGRPAIFPALLAGWSGKETDRALTDEAELQAIAICTRQLARMLDREHSPYRDWLTRRLAELLVGVPPM
jgi:aminoglycoside phosphotransferase (APT) family kinase protein